MITTFLVFLPFSSFAQLARFTVLQPTCNSLSSQWTPAWSSVIEYWPLDGTVGAISNGATIPATVGTNGTASSSAMAYATGQIKQGVSFSGSGDYITIPSIAAMQNAAQFTISAWVKPTNFNSQVTVAGVDTLAKLELETNGTASFLISNSGSAWNAQPQSTTTLTTGVWTHLVGTYNGTTTVLYINGVNSASSTAMTGSLGTNGTNFQISGIQGGVDVVTGMVDEVAVWTTGLTQAQVTTLYQRQYCNGK